MLFAKEVAAVEMDFISVLEHTPGTKSEKQAYFQSRGIRVPRTNYEAMWEVLTERLHHSGAGSAVLECLRANMPNRLKELLQQARRGKVASLRANESAIVWDFFFQKGNLRRVTLARIMSYVFLKQTLMTGSEEPGRKTLSSYAKRLLESLLEGPREITE